MRIRITQAARKHRVGGARVRHVMATVTPTRVVTSSGEAGWLYVGTDQRGVEIEVIAIEQSGQLLVIHAMPTHYRRRS